jgi:hypothetical protein
MLFVVVGFPFFGQKMIAATTITPTVNQLTPIHVLRSKWTRKMGLYSAANTPKIIRGSGVRVTPGAFFSGEK